MASLFIEGLDGKPINISLIQTVYLDPEDNKNVVFQFINGEIFKEELDSEEEATNRLNNVITELKTDEGGGSSGFSPDWSEIGYQDTPSVIVTAFEHAKNIYDNWDSSQTNLNSKFRMDANLVYMPLVDTSNVTNMNACFNYCSRLIIVPLLNTSKVTDIGHAFTRCSNLEKVALLDTSNVITMDYTFQECTSLKEIPQFNTGNCKNFSYTFYDCLKLKSVPVLDTSKCTSYKNMFGSCPGLTDESLNNIMRMCINMTSLSSTATKTLKQAGITPAQATSCQSLSNYQDFLDAGWTTGY